MTMQKNQIYLYSIKASSLFNEEEMLLQQLIYKLQKEKAPKEEIKQLNQQLVDKLNLNTSIRVLKSSQLTESKKIAQFESSFSRALNIETNSITTDFFIIEVFHQAVMEQIIEKGFMFNGEHYTYKFSGAGQIRNKKLVFVKESRYQLVENKLTAGLTDKMIDTVNINKLIAYKALCASSSIKWECFDIDKAIVVDDFEHLIKDVEVDYIGSNYEVTRKPMNIVNKVMDGAGIMLPSVSDKNMQFRGPWFKGLLTPFDFHEFIEKHNKANPIVKDVWGESWNIIDDDIRIIFSASQFKMWKYYSNEVEVEDGKVLKGWDLFKYLFKNYDCEFSICDIEEDSFDDKPVTVNYQMLQTLYDMPEQDLIELGSHTKQYIEQATKTTKNMIRFIVNKKKPKSIDKAILLHNELINDTYIKQMIMDKKAALIKDARAGNIIIPNAARTYIIPDTYAFCQWLFGLEVTGLLEDGQVSCKLYSDEKELDVLRSPHLYIEHAVRTNVVNEHINGWFTTNGIYTSINDPISTILMFDNDGDQALIVDDEIFVRNAKDHTKEREHTKEIVPLQYEMSVAKAQTINSTNIIESLKSAFKMNIGNISNTISKVFGQDEITDEDLKLVKQLTYQNNMAIDFAKTLFFTEPKGQLKNKLNKLKARQLPSFFIYAKDKPSKKVAKRNNSTVNQLYDAMKTKNLTFERKEFDYTYLLKDMNVQLDYRIIGTYAILVEHSGLEMKKILQNQGVKVTQLHIFQAIREELLNLNADADYVVDVLAKFLYEKNSPNKKFLWECFGEEILINLKRNLGKIKVCECKVEFEPTSNRQKLCPECGEKASKEAARLRKQKSRAKKIS